MWYNTLLIKAVAKGDMMWYYMQLTHSGQEKAKAQPLTDECQSIGSLFAFLQRDLPFTTLQSQNCLTGI